MGGFFCGVVLLLINLFIYFQSVLVIQLHSVFYVLFLDAKDKCALVSKSLQVMMIFVILVFLNASIGVVAKQ